MTTSTTRPTWAPAGPTHALLVDGRRVGPAWEAHRRGEVRRGLLGTDGLDGAVLLRRCRSVHSVGMRYALDVAFVDRDGRVRAVVGLPPRRLTRTHWSAADTLEAPTGSFEAWELREGSVVGLVPTDAVTP